MFRKMPFILLFLVGLIGLCQPWIPLGFQSVLYGLSLSIKSVIVFALPMIIFGLLFKTAVQLSQKASKMILLILSAICVSNFLSTMLSYSFGSLAYQFDLSMTTSSSVIELQPYWFFELPKLIGNAYAMLAGLILGVSLGLLNPILASKIALKLELVVSVILKGFLYIIPIFIGGFVMKMFHDQVMGHILHNYGQIFALIACAVFAYIALLYFVASKLNEVLFIQSLKNMMPAAITGFGTMSSAAAMPLTLLGAEKNSRNPDLARSIIPATVNIHLIGDCFAVPIFAFAILKSFGMPEPSFANYLVFAGYFLMAKFSIAAVPGGGILVMLPILESYLGLKGDMLSLITALYILFDPIITCANVLGNGAFAMALSQKQQTREKTV